MKGRVLSLLTWRQYLCLLLWYLYPKRKTEEAGTATNNRANPDRNGPLPMPLHGREWLVAVCSSGGRAIRAFYDAGHHCIGNLKRPGFENVFFNSAIMAMDQNFFEKTCLSCEARREVLDVNSAPSMSR